MKKLMLAVGLMLGGVAFVNAQDTQSDTTTTTTTEQTDQTTTEDQSTKQDETAAQDQSVNYQDQEKEGQKIEINELPAAVQTKLQGNDYQGWVVTTARKKMTADPNNAQATSKEVYVVEVKNGAETKTLKFDKDGNEVEDLKKDKDDQK